MVLSFLSSFQSEWLKKRHSAASWLTVLGGCLIPVIILISRIDDHASLPAGNLSDHLWEAIYHRSWQFMGMFLLPMGVILATSLITQVEFRNNTWKQLHTTPQSLTTIFSAKLVVIIVMMVQFFILFNIGIYLSAVVPGLFFRGVPYPKEAIPFQAFLKGDVHFFIACLPIIALQYLLSLQFKNFLVPIGAGLALYVASMIATIWKYGYIVPYSYCALSLKGGMNPAGQRPNIQAWAIGYFMTITLVSYILYIAKREKG
jgi:hypothetical protein